MRHSRTLRAAVTTGSLALVSGMLAATAAALPASALAPASDGASVCIGGDSGATANARVRKGAKQLEPELFSGRAVRPHERRVDRVPRQLILG